jgi:hypothetical protein
MRFVDELLRNLVAELRFWRGNRLYARRSAPTRHLVGRVDGRGPRVSVTGGLTGVVVSPPGVQSPVDR